MLSSGCQVQRTFKRRPAAWASLRRSSMKAVVLGRVLARAATSGTDNHNAAAPNPSKASTQMIAPR